MGNIAKIKEEQIHTYIQKILKEEQKQEQKREQNDGTTNGNLSTASKGAGVVLNGSMLTNESPKGV